MGAALDFGSCAVSSRTKAERYKIIQETRLVDAHQGYMALPRKCSHDSKAQRTLFAWRRSMPNESGCVAVVDDDPIMGESLQRALELEGWRAVWWHTGKKSRRRYVRAVS